MRFGSLAASAARSRLRSAFSPQSANRRQLHAESIHAGLIPEGWPRGVEDRFQHLNQTTLLRRPIFTKLNQDVISPLIEGIGAGRFILIDGERGVGKSAVLLQAVEEARKGGVLVLYIPKARQWTRGDGFFSPTFEDDDWQNGVVKWYDRPKQTEQLLKSFWNAHREVLEDLPVKSSVGQEKGRGAQSIGDLVQTGIQILESLEVDWKSGPRRAGDILSAVLAELAEIETIPVAIAIDDYDAMLGMTCIENERGRALHSHGIRVIGEHFGQSAAINFASRLKRGIFLAATSYGLPPVKCRRKRILCSSDYPATSSLLDDPHGLQWIAAFRKETDETGNLDSKYRLVVPRFSREETANVLAEFQKNKFRRMDEQRLEKLRVLSGGRPDTLHKICLTV